MPGEQSSESRISGIKVVHIIGKSYPSLNGYSIRSHELFSAQKRGGIVSPTVITSPFYRGVPGMDRDIEIDNIRYIRTAH